MSHSCIKKTRIVPIIEVKTDTLHYEINMLKGFFTEQWTVNIEYVNLADGQSSEVLHTILK